MAVLVEFRDGEHPVPDHVAAILRNVDCTSMTKAEAIKASQNQLVKDHLNGIQRRMVAGHFRERNRF